VLPGGGWGPGTIWYQRLLDGAPDGAPVRVSAGGTDDALDDVSGRYVVYTAWDAPGALSGRIIVHDLASATSVPIAHASVLQEARIAGTKVAWLQGHPGDALLMLADLATGAPPARIAGPSPSPDEIALGDRFLVWSELSGAQRDVRAYDLAAGTRSDVAALAGVDERLPATDGPWVAFEARPIGASAHVELLNLDTRERRVVPGRGGADGAPSVSGDLVAYASDVGAGADVLVYRISAADTFQVTSDAWDQRAIDVLGGLVAWVDARLGTPDVYVSALAFVDGATGAGGGDVGPEAAVEAAIASVRALDRNAFARPQLQAVLLWKLAVVRRMVDAGAFAGAAAKLRRDVLAKTDGCALRGTPDANDWIVDCAAQAAVRDAIQRAIAALRDARPSKG
jgi:hypothetical protein